MTGSRTTQVPKDRRVAGPPHRLRRALKTQQNSATDGADALNPPRWPGEPPDGGGSNQVRPLARSPAHDTRLKQHTVLKHATCHR